MRNRNKAEAILTHDYVRDALSYDHETGQLIWLTDRVAVSGVVVAAAGDVAGYFDPVSGYSFVHFYGAGLVRTHRLVWFWVTGRWPCGPIDHINGCRSDNRFANLRDGGYRVNRENVTRARSDSIAGLMGVHMRHNKGGSVTFIARITVDRKPTTLGFFSTAQDAHNAYVVAKRKFHEGCTI